MTATSESYLPRYYSEIVREAGSYDDCAICSGLVLLDAATLGEAVTRPDGRLMDTVRLRELRDEAGLQPDGPLRLNDIARYLTFIDPEFRLDYYPGHPGGTLRLTWDEFKARVRAGGVAMLLGNPIGVTSETSPLRSRQANDDYAHAIALMDGTDAGARVYDPLTRNRPEWRGERIPWPQLREFTEASKAGERLYGTPTAIACAVSRVGSETQAARAGGSMGKSLTKCRDALASQKAQTALAIEERDQARHELALAEDVIARVRTLVAA